MNQKDPKWSFSTWQNMQCQCNNVGSTACFYMSSLKTRLRIHCSPIYSSDAHGTISWVCTKTMLACDQDSTVSMSLTIHWRGNLCEAVCFLLKWCHVLLTPRDLQKLRTSMLHWPHGRDGTRVAQPSAVTNRLHLQYSIVVLMKLYLGLLPAELFEKRR